MNIIKFTPIYFNLNTQMIINPPPRWKIKRAMTIAAFAFLLLLLLTFVTLWIMSPGKKEPLTDASGNVIAGSLSEKIYVEINGVKQGMFIESLDEANPVLLYLHGGMPDYFLSRKYPAGLETVFTVVWWEQRGSGMSFGSSGESQSLEQMVLDVIVVTNYLRARFGKSKIYLMGHSGGTFIGMHAIAKHPELFSAYIGVAQMAGQLKSEQQAYLYMLNRYKENGNKRMIRKLEAAPVTSDGTPRKYLLLRDIAMHDLGVGTMHGMNSVITGIFFASLGCRDYTPAEKYRMWSGKAKSGVSMLWERMLKCDLSEDIPAVTIPVYFFHGIYDLTCSYDVAKLYFEKLDAPVKEFFTFEKSAHSPVFEEPVKTMKIIREVVLAGESLSKLDSIGSFQQ
jgi:pimeloyl-ACP methyl ester carboxylesterase